MRGYFWDLFRGKGKEEPGDFTDAHMGEENNFYYNKELGRWAVRGEEDKIAGTTNTAPPPPKIPESDCPPRMNVTNNAASRGPLTSAKLYTKIPGIEVMETKQAREKDSFLPLTAKSQFTPESSGNNNDYDFVN